MTQAVPLRPCWVCRQPVPGGRCRKHPPTAYQYRPQRPSETSDVYGVIHAALRRAVLERDGYRCGYCCLPAATVDHIVPHSRGGATVPDNLIAACADCNRSKKDSTVAEWIESGRAPAGARVVLRRLQREPG